EPQLVDQLPHARRGGLQQRAVGHERNGSGYLRFPRNLEKVQKPRVEQRLAADDQEFAGADDASHFVYIAPELLDIREPRFEQRRSMVAMLATQVAVFRDRILDGLQQNPLY